MANWIEISTLNPINLVDKSRELGALYNFKHFDAWLAEELGLPWQQGPCYYQPWQTNDTIKIQAKVSNLAPVRLKIRNNIGAVVHSQLFDYITTAASIAYYEISFTFASLGEGYYRVNVEAGDPVQVVLESEAMDVREEWPGTLLFSYSNLFNNDILWETDFAPTYRVDGVLADYLPKSRRTTYIDQPGNISLVKGVARRTQQLIIGNRIGVPDHVIDKLTEIFDQNIVDVDGKGYAAVEGAEFSPKRIERYLWSQWNMEVGETNNRRGKRFESTGIQEQKVVIDYVVEGALFGPVSGNPNNTNYNIRELT